MSLDWTKDVRFTPVNTDEMDGYRPPVKVAATRYILWIFLAAAYLVPLMTYRTNAWHSFSLTFVAILLEAMPFMLLGSLIGRPGTSTAGKPAAPRPRKALYSKRPCRTPHSNCAKWCGRDACFFCAYFSVFAPLLAALAFRFGG